MVKLAIRDDDLNFFTKVDEIVEIYSSLNDFPVSFAVIPTVLDVSTKGSCPETKGNNTPKYIGDNLEICSWLRARVKEKKADILMHGITHQYKFRHSGEKMAEMQWRRDDKDLVNRLTKMKLLMSELFDYDIRCFVAPSNKISSRCLKSVVDAGYQCISGIIPIKYNQKFTVTNFLNYIKRWFFRIFTRLPYPGILSYSDHIEINACQLISYDYLVRMFDLCNKKGFPMVINVHYWSLRDKPKELQLLRDFIKYALSNDAQPSLLNEIISSKL